MTPNGAGLPATRARARREQQWHDAHLPQPGSSSRAFGSYWQTPGGRVRYRRRLGYLQQVLSSLPVAAPVLIIGSGDGSWAGDVKRLVAGPVHALDVSFELCRRTRMDNGVTVVAGDAHELPYPASTFAAVVSISVLHHLDLEIAIREIRRVLRVGGVLVGSEPNGLNPQVRWMQSGARRRTRYGLTPDERAFTMRTLENALARSFPVARVRPFDFWHPALGGARPHSLRERVLRIPERIPVLRLLGGSLWFEAYLGAGTSEK